MIVGMAVPIIANSPIADAFTFNQGDIMDDAIFNNTSSMDSADIDGFLNTFGSSCISTNHGFSAPDPTGYSPESGFTYGGNVSAGTVIADAANAYQLNPEVLLATLQKEQSLVTGSSGCSVSAYAGAMGYGCPDGGSGYSYSGVDIGTINGSEMSSISNTCVNSSSKVGFSQQVIHAAWLLKFGEEKSEGNTDWAVINGSWDNCDDNGTCPSAWNIPAGDACYSGPMVQGTYATCPGGSTTYYDGYTTIDGTSVLISDGATAALYWYTPHFSGNENFFSIFTGWFGTTTTGGYSYNLLGHQVYTDSSMSTPQDSTSLVAGQRYYAAVQVQNTGNTTWYQGQVNLGTWNPQDRPSIIKDWTWPSPSNDRAAYLQQSTVAPGADGSYGFWFVAPPKSSLIDWEAFNLVVEGVTWMPDNGNLVFGLQSSQAPNYSYSLLGHQLYTDSSMSTPQNSTSLTPGQRYYAYVEVQNTGNTTWYQGEDEMATWGPANRASIIKDWTWPSTQNNRAGTMSQSVVPPGGTATFGFWMVAPPASSSIDWEQFTLYYQNSNNSSWMSPQGVLFGVQS